jgi:hypothetical protein
MRVHFRALLTTALVTNLWSQTADVPSSGGNSAATRAWQRFAAQSHATLGALQQGGSGDLPPAPAGVADLQFSEFFGPIGDRGLEYSPRLRALDGRNVRLVGYMVREQEHAPGIFLFAGWPVSIQTKGVCVIDNPPPTAVHVRMPSSLRGPIPYRPGRIVLVGRIELGSRLEADGRNSFIRLFLDAPSAAQFLPAAAGATP